MKRKNILLILLILLTSCHDNSNILASENIANLEDVKNFDSKLSNDALVSDGYYQIYGKKTYFKADFKTELFVQETIDFKVGIELNEKHQFILKQGQGKIEKPKHTYLNLNYEYWSNTFYTIDGTTYQKHVDGDFYSYTKTPSSISTIFGLPSQCSYNLERVINLYTYPIPTTYINDTQIYIKENYPIESYDSDCYLQATYSNQYKKLEELKINSIYISGDLAVQFELNIKSIDAFKVDNVPEINEFKEYKCSYLYIDLY